MPVSSCQVLIILAIHSSPSLYAQHDFSLSIHRYILTKFTNSHWSTQPSKPSIIIANDPIPNIHFQPRLLFIRIPKNSYRSLRSVFRFRFFLKDSPSFSPRQAKRRYNVARALKERKGGSQSRTANEQFVYKCNT